ncbi:MAG: RnfABCDGE type electron transport complex subunit B [Clostridia bacterium]|nr:RnfABCDGE type electron transport complex subunit B [Clostridia bacterium]
MNNILYAALVLGGMGLVFGLLLTFVSKVFAVPANPQRDAVREVLPGANCGACGFPGCDGCADAIAAGKAPVNACPVGGAAAGAQIAKIMGVESADDGVKKVATVICQGTNENCKTKFDYHGIQDCVAASLVSDGNRSCKYACLGLGTCVRTCPFDAIHIDEEKKIAVVDPEKCQSCGKCIAACPKHVLELHPVERPVQLMCRAQEFGKAVTDNCKKGCIGCRRCEKACKFGAITMVNNLPVIDTEKCRGCMMCAEACPTGAMTGDFENRTKAEINKDNCIGCGLCKRQCQFDAIVGEVRKPHEILDACTGCGACAEKCPKKTITMVKRVNPRDPKAVAPAPAPAEDKQ